MDESIVKEFEQQQVGKLELSQAIRIGAKLRPQTTGCAFRDGRSCAWGAAWEGSGHPYEEGKSYAEIFSSDHAWVEANSRMFHTTGLGIASNNDLGWTREQIADWLESQGL